MGRSCLLFFITMLMCANLFAGELSEIRQNRRLQQQTVLQNNPQSSFSIMVIPVDFADARFPSNEHALSEVSDLLYGNDGKNIENYFATASHNRLNLNLIVTPVVHLANDRLYYSFFSCNCFEKLRWLAQESINNAIVNGAHLGLFDNNGPDMIPNSGDDDAEVDGIMILHAGVGIENDPDGLIHPLNYFLSDPIIDDGITAKYFSIASLSSDLGVHAHEMAHLFGLEDRYDVYLSSDETQNYGGLGDYSLMASGYNPSGSETISLLDAYSASLLGWVDVVGPENPLQGTITLNSLTIDTKVFKFNSSENEYFLAEVRGELNGFDSHLPDNQMIIYHIDEAVPDDGQSSPDPDNRHIRVSVLEADGNSNLANGTDHGTPADLFPGTDFVSTISSHTNPSTNWYNQQSTFQMIEISPGENCVTFDYSCEADVEISLSLYPAPSLSCNSFGRSLEGTIISLAVADNSHGSFEGGYLEWSSPLVSSHDNVWEPELQPTWVASQLETNFMIAVSISNDVPISPAEFSFNNISNSNAFNIDENWGASWAAFNSGETNWQWWDSAPNIVKDGSGVLVCTASVSDDDWPNLQYEINNISKLTSLNSTTSEKVAVVHFIDSYELANQSASAGAIINSWDSNLNFTTLVPASGYPTYVNQTVDSSLSAKKVFGGFGEYTDSGLPLWQLSVFDLPEQDRGIEFYLDTGPVCCSQGWFIHSVDIVDESFPAFVPELSSDYLLNWSFQLHPVQKYIIEYSHGTNWLTLAETENTDFSVSSILSGNHQFSVIKFRVIAELEFGSIVSGLLEVNGNNYTENDLNLLSATDSESGINLILNLPESSSLYSLQIFDMMGRQINMWNYSAGSYIHHWDGTSDSGNLVASGCYISKISNANYTQVRKVLWVR